jgi:hypothetical protein
MCRLFGFVSRKPVAVAHLLEDIYRIIREDITFTWRWMGAGMVRRV